jgi:hypothetical protein
MGVIMSSKFTIGLIAMLSLFAVPLVLAGHHYGGYGHGMGHSWNLSDRDANQDGMLSFEEFSAPQIDMMRNGFSMIDTDKDGKISAGEWNTFLEAHGVSSKES